MLGRIWLVIVLAAVGLAVPHGGTSVAEAVTPVRVHGPDRVGTSVALSQHAFPSAEVAVVASSQAFADALTATPLAAAHDGPVLLTPRHRLDDRVEAELQRLGVTTVLLVGGERAQSSDVEAALDRVVDRVERVAGVDRFATAGEVATRTVARWRADGDADAGRRVVVALGARPGGGAAWPDALAAGVLGGVAHRPILLVTTTDVPQHTRRALEGLGADDAIVAGGRAAVSDAVAAALGTATTRRIGGADRYETSTLLADAAIAAGASPRAVVAVTGASYADALSAGAATLRRGGVLVLVDGRDLDWSRTVRDWLRARPAVDDLLVAGGAAAIAAPVLGQLDRAVDGFSPPGLRLERVYATPPGAAPRDVPLGLTAAPNDDRSFVWRRYGQVLQLDGAGIHSFLDLTGRVRTDGERGLLGFAAHPAHARNGRVFAHYSRRSDGATIVSEFRRRDARTADPGSERILFIAGQPASNHNGGTLAFGPDGFLYLFLGDGGGAGDAYGHAQNIDTPLGGVVRLDVATPGVAWPAAGNPYIGRRGDDRLWARGLRNPYRAAFDPPTRTLFIADVGQDAREEVNAVDAGLPGLDYGWPILEGDRCYPSGGACDRAGRTAPVLVYDHGQGCSVTGGHVYRGRIGMLRGHYFYGDFCRGWIRSFRLVGGAVTEGRDWTGELGFGGMVFSFGQDGRGEVYVVSAAGVDRIVER